MNTKEFIFNFLEYFFLVIGISFIVPILMQASINPIWFFILGVIFILVGAGIRGRNSVNNENGKKVRKQYIRR